VVCRSEADVAVFLNGPNTIEVSVGGTETKPPVLMGAVETIPTTNNIKTLMNNSIQRIVVESVKYAQIGSDRVLAKNPRLVTVFSIIGSVNGELRRSGTAERCIESVIDRPRLPRSAGGRLE
jgi:hypothetical protein